MYTMWTEILTEEQLSGFMAKMHSFHDCCVREMKYVSGAYVDHERDMHAVNDKRCLSVIIQSQAADAGTVEMEFSGLKFLHLAPPGTDYTCEISCGALFFTGDGDICWSDSDDLTPENMKDIGTDWWGTVIRAERLRWRPAEE